MHDWDSTDAVWVTGLVIAGIGLWQTTGWWALVVIGGLIYVTGVFLSFFPSLGLRWRKSGQAAETRRA